MVFQVLWFFIWAMLWAVYFMLDGFDFGVGILYNFLGEEDKGKRALLHTIGPVWDGNEVWLITAGGATLGAFPAVYASMFSYLYTPMLLILFALILRGVALEFRNKEEGRAWKRGWDTAIFAGSLVPSFLFGTAFGNIFQGLPMDESGYHGTFLTLLNPYGLLTGLLFVLSFLVHGALWLAWKTRGAMNRKASYVAGRLWTLLFFTLTVFVIASGFYTHLYANYLKYGALFSLPLMAFLCLIGMRIFRSRGETFPAFVSSCLFIVLVVLSGMAGLYPNLIPSSLDPGQSLTVFNSSSSLYTLKIMTAVALAFVPVVIAYQTWIYRIFRHKAGDKGPAQGPEAY